MEKYIIDKTSNDNYYLVKKENGKELCKIAKKCNDLEAVKRLIGVFNIKEII